MRILFFSSIPALSPPRSGIWTSNFPSIFFSVVEVLLLFLNLIFLMKQQLCWSLEERMLNLEGMFCEEWSIRCITFLLELGVIFIWVLADVPKVGPDQSWTNWTNPPSLRKGEGNVGWRRDRKMRIECIVLESDDFRNSLSWASCKWGQAPVLMTSSKMFHKLGSSSSRVSFRATPYLNKNHPPLLSCVTSNPDSTRKGSSRTEPWRHFNPWEKNFKGKWLLEMKP